MYFPRCLYTELFSKSCLTKCRPQTVGKRIHTECSDFPLCTRRFFQECHNSGARLLLLPHPRHPNERHQGSHFTSVLKNVAFKCGLLSAALGPRLDKERADISYLQAYQLCNQSLDPWLAKIMHEHASSSL